ncbi:MAG TPA: SRPBCC domain-containing protein [Allosphingosinicella sp.]|jgi:uncharacterized protein YndB with AHSA1/START domain
MLDDISDSIEIDAGRERVWEVLTTASLVEEWLGCIGFKAEIGTTFYMQPDPGKRANRNIEGATHCELEELDEPFSMRFSWFMPGTPKTHVMIGLDETAPGRTRVALRHAGWDQFDPDDIRGVRDMLAGGWRSYVLPSLKRVAERR